MSLTFGHYPIKVKVPQYKLLSSISQLWKWIPCNVGVVYIFEHGLYITALEHSRMLILSNCNVLLALINTVYKHSHASVDLVKCM